MPSPKVNAPTVSASHPNYRSECQFALEPSLQGLIDMAVEAGWDRRQVSLAIWFLAAQFVREQMPLDGMK